MGVRGRKPKSNSLKLIQGSRNVNTLEPTVSTDIPACPPHIQGEARAEWTRLVPELHRAGLLTAIDGAALAAYCQTWARWVSAERMIKREGSIITTATGNRVQNPRLRIATKAADQMLRYLQEFGMTPSSRSRLKVSPPKVDDELEQFLKLSN